MVRIAQVVEATEGGCKRHVLDLLTGLDRERFRQTAVVGLRREPGIADEIAARTGGAVEIVPWDVRREIHPLSDWVAARTLRRRLRDGDFDLVHCHSAKAGFLGRLAARGLGAAVLYTPHCLPFLMDVPAPTRAFYRWLERLAGRSTDRLVAVSPSEAGIAAAARLVPRHRLVTIENGIDPPAATPVDRSGKRAELGLSETSAVVLSLGALRRQKGYAHLVGAAAATRESCPQAVFLIAGEGTLRPALERQIARLGLAGRVRLLGWRDDTAELVAAADLFVMSSLWEAGPYALLEAMAAGLPVVGTRVPGVTDWVTEGKTGFVAEPADSRSLAAAVAAALSDPGEAKRRADAARDMVLRRNTKERWLRDMTSLYEEMTRPRPTA